MNYYRMQWVSLIMSAVGLTLMLGGICTLVYIIGYRSAQNDAVQNSNACFYVDQSSYTQFTWDCSTIDRQPKANQ